MESVLGYASQLRAELAERAAVYARESGCAAPRTHMEWGTVIFEPSGLLHGNFHPRSYREILASRPWRQRLRKPLAALGHTTLADDRRPLELDSCCSSDALLMNVFCHPAVLRSRELRLLLEVPDDAVPIFGWRARVPLKEDKFDRTEVDMRWGNLLVEAKLTEPAFDSCGVERMESYLRFREIFNRRALRQVKKQFPCYQLLRNVLAAEAHDANFCLLCDARRPDLINEWFQVLSAIRPLALRMRCKLLTWQELARGLPVDLQRFLDCKYGISGD